MNDAEIESAFKMRVAEADSEPVTMVAPRSGMTREELFEEVVAPWRAARRLPLASRYAAAVSHNEKLLREILYINVSQIRTKLRSGARLSRREQNYLIAKISQKNKLSQTGVGRPKTPHEKSRIIFRAVDWTAREFDLNPTRGAISEPFSAADAVADALRRIGVGPAGFDRVRKIFARQRKMHPSREVALAELGNAIRASLIRVNFIRIVEPEEVQVGKNTE